MPVKFKPRTSRRPRSNGGRCPCASGGAGRKRRTARRRSSSVRRYTRGNRRRYRGGTALYDYNTANMVNGITTFSGVNTAASVLNGSAHISSNPAIHPMAINYLV
jgi:hypothetical protein